MKFKEEVPHDKICTQGGTPIEDTDGKLKCFQDDQCKGIEDAGIYCVKPGFKLPEGWMKEEGSMIVYKNND